MTYEAKRPVDISAIDYPEFERVGAKSVQEKRGRVETGPRSYQWNLIQTTACSERAISV